MRKDIHIIKSITFDLAVAKEYLERVKKWEKLINYLKSYIRRKID